MRAGIDEAACLVIALPEGFDAGVIAESARQLNEDITIFARAHSDSEVDHLIRLKVNQVIMGEQEIAGRLLKLIGRRKLPVGRIAE